MRTFVLAAIRIYQRYVSPYKGFCCAYRQHTGRASCSALGYRAVSRYGVFAGLSLTRKRTRLCGIAHRRFKPMPSYLNHERGVCDVGCDLPCDTGCDASGACDGPSGRSIFSNCNFFSCCDCGSCDWPRRDRKGQEKEKYVYIPPTSSGHLRRAQVNKPNSEA